MKVLEISECFPNKFKPVTGEFILRHSKSLSEHCEVMVLVPLRAVPPRELFSMNIILTFRKTLRWISSITSAKNFSGKSFYVCYLKYFSLPRPFFESLNNSIVNFFFYQKAKNLCLEFNPDVICCNWIVPWAALSERLAGELNIPFVIDHHEDLPTFKKKFPRNYKSLLSVFEKTAKIIVHSSINENELKSEIPYLPEIKKIYLGQNFAADDTKKKFSLNVTKLICVSHLNEDRKNIDILLKAFKILNLKFPGLYELTIIGGGILKEKYIRLADSLGLNSNKIFLGEKIQIDVETHLNASDIFVLPSYPEAFGIVFIEALAKGLPVVTCEGNGGGEELKKLGYPVTIVKSFSENDIAEALEKLSLDRNKMTEISEAGKKIIMNTFSWKINARNTFDFLKETVEEYKIENQCAE